MRRSGWGAALLAMLLLVASGCGGSAKEQQGSETAPVAAAGKPADRQPVAGVQYSIVGAESKAAYEVKEVFVVDALNVTAIGTTSAITGDLVLDGGSLKGGTVVVDVTQLKSDQRMRDNALKDRGLETNKYKTAEFTITGMEGGPVTAGQEVAVKLIGQAKIHGQARALTWEGQAKLEGDTLRLTAEVAFKLELFGIEPPNIAGRIRVADDAKLKIEFVAKQI